MSFDTRVSCKNQSNPKIRDFFDLLNVAITYSNVTLYFYWDGGKRGAAVDFTVKYVFIKLLIINFKAKYLHI